MNEKKPLGTKYIIVPEYRPLWAMARCFGPKYGPLTHPHQIPLDVIRDLINQKGRDQVTVLEVVPIGKNKYTGTIQYSDPIQLTADNYATPYEELAGIKEPLQQAKSEPIEKTVIAPTPAPIPAKEETLSEPVEETVTEPEPEKVEENPIPATVPEAEATKDVPVEEKTDPYAGMSKRERKEARRRERELAAISEAASETNEE